jgi:hypothetical protein
MSLKTPHSRPSRLPDHLIRYAESYTPKSPTIISITHKIIDPSSPGRPRRRRRPSSSINHLPLPINLILSCPRLRLPPWRWLDCQPWSFLQQTCINNRYRSHKAILVLHVPHATAPRLPDILGQADKSCYIVLVLSADGSDRNEEGHDLHNPGTQ